MPENIKYRHKQTFGRKKCKVSVRDKAGKVWYDIFGTMVRERETKT